jgi:hypothetical protein
MVDYQIKYEYCMSIDRRELKKYYHLARQVHSFDKPVLEIEDLTEAEKEVVWEIYLMALLAAEHKFIARCYFAHASNFLTDSVDQSLAYSFYRVFDSETRDIAHELSRHMVYELDRQPYIPFAKLAEYLPSSKLSLLEIGGGNGSNTIKMVSQLTELGYQVNATLTALNELKNHQQIRDHGVAVSTHTLVEKLPQSWTETYDVVVSVVCLAWSNVHYALDSIQRVLKPGGIWINFDCYDGPRSDPSREAIFGNTPFGFNFSTIEGALLTKMDMKEMEVNRQLTNLVNDNSHYYHGQPLYNVVTYQKPK